MNRKEQSATVLMPLLTLAVLASCLLGVLFAGAEVYSRLVDQAEQLFEDRIGLQYVAARVRQSETAGLEEFGGVTALAFWEETEGEAYVTRVYLWEGYIRELYCEADASLGPEAGEKVLPARTLEFTLEDGLLTVQTEGGTIRILLRSGKEIGP